MTSPGPGWWLASDGKWYPQRWEYQTWTAHDYPKLIDAVKQMKEIANSEGQQGWETVNFTVQAQESRGWGHFSSEHTRYQPWNITWLMKRPLAQ
jgi:hypothetical protein